MIIDYIKGLLLGIFIVIALLVCCMALDSADEISNVNETGLPQNVPKDTIILDNGSNVAVNSSLGIIKVKSSDLVHIEPKYPTITMTGKPSCSCGKYSSYTWRTRSYVNYCPYCHRYGTLYNAHKWQSRFENEITCRRCGSDWCINCGKEKYSWSRKYLKRA